MATKITEEEYNKGNKFPFIYNTLEDAEATAKENGYDVFKWHCCAGNIFYYKVD